MKGFTLIEMMLAVVLLAMLASAAALSFQQPLRLARARDAIELVRSFDETARQAARNLGHGVTLGFNLSTAHLARTELDRITYECSLPHDCRLREIRTSARRVAGGEIAVPISALGVSRTYAVHLTGSGFDRWLLVSGLSGEVTAIQDEAQLDAIFAATAARNEARDMEPPPGNDAD